jgi:hypothetical protein
VDARHIRAFTPVFRQAMAGHDGYLRTYQDSSQTHSFVLAAQVTSEL